MTAPPGSRLLEFLRGLRSAEPARVQGVAETAAGSTWQLRGATWHAEVRIEPSRWIGLVFEAAEPTSDRRIGYDVDTDLYDISRADQREFTEAIENDIIEFLDHLEKGQVLRGRDGARAVLVVPHGASFLRIVRGRFATATSTHSTRSEAQAGGAYEPVV